MYYRFIVGLARLAVCGASFAFSTAIASGQTSNGTIEGRVLNPATGEYLQNARVSVVGTDIEKQTDALGQYRLVNVPAGTVTVRAFFTGLEPQTTSVTVAAGQTVQHDISLRSFSRPASAGQEGLVHLSEFVVSSSREMDGAAIAINEQRFASNIRNVVAADEFGIIAEGNVGEFMKFIPGVTIGYGGGDARTISLNGVPSNYVPITVGGFNLASAASSGTGRQVELEQVSMNNISRIEVSFSPTPEISGASLAGSVNFVPRGAFERVKPEFKYTASLAFRDTFRGSEDRSLDKTPGPHGQPTRKVHPAVDFSYVAPVNKKFGFTLGGATSTIFAAQDLLVNDWRGAGVGFNGTASPAVPFDQPYLSGYKVNNGTKNSSRSSVSLTADWRLSPRDRLTLALSYAYFKAEFSDRSITFNITGNAGAVGNASPVLYTTPATHGATGAGRILIDNDSRQKSGTTYMPTLTYRHDGPLWKAEAGLGYSRSSNHYEDIGQGYFRETHLFRDGVTISFDDVGYEGPRRITVTNATPPASAGAPAVGSPVDPYNLASYALNNTVSDTRNSYDQNRSAFGNLSRNLTMFGVPMIAKAGFNVVQQARDIRGIRSPWAFRGANGIQTQNPNVAGFDDSPVPFLDEQYSQRTSPYGLPKVQWVSNEKAWAYYQQNPTHFLLDEGSRFRSSVNESKRAEETVSAAYFRVDSEFFKRRLKLVAGLRAEQTNIDALGPLNDPTKNYQRDANGNIIRVGTTPQTIFPANSLAASQLIYKDRGLHFKKEYLRWFPSVNASFNLSENFIVRGAYYWSIGRPDFFTYVNGIILPDTAFAASTTNTIRVANPNIKPWKAETYKVNLEYYFPRVGVLSVGGFVRDFENFFRTITFAPSSEFLDFYDIDSAVYGSYLASAQTNLADPVRMTGVDLNYKQNLTLLPDWARGVQVFGSASAQRVTGVNADQFQIVARTYSWGASLNRERFNLRANWNFRGPERRNLITGLAPGTYVWLDSRLYVDVTAEVAISKRFSLFANGRNVLDATEDALYYSPVTPEVAKLHDRQDFGALWTIGIKGSF